MSYYSFEHPNEAAESLIDGALSAILDVRCILFDFSDIVERYEQLKAKEDEPFVTWEDFQVRSSS